MLENIKHVSNPLTIIAIFAAIAEVGATVVLPFIPAQSQQIFLWFLIGFPTLLVLLFFLTLNFNHRVLYAPSDYREDSSFLAASRIQNNQLPAPANPTGIPLVSNASAAESKA